jgi:signal transduction histidine kinase
MIKMVEKSEEYIKDTRNDDDDVKQELIHILLIEDNLGDIRLIQEMLCDTRNSKLTLRYKQNLEAGIQHLSDEHFDLVLLDLSLPDSIGLNSLCRLMETKINIPIIVLTGTNDEMLAIQAVKSGAQDYLVKGMINKIILERSIYYAIERFKITEELKNSQLKYREAFNRAEFFKDLFAHDMNNILQAIMSETQVCNLILKKKENPTELKEYFEFIINDIKRGAKLISNVRKISQLQQTDFILNNVNVINLLNRSIFTIKNEFNKRTIDIKVKSYNEDIQICANSYLQDVFDNLLVNSIIHNENHIVELVINITKEKIENKDYFRMEFIDNGTGIEDERKKIIFQRGFKQDKSIFGMGLGLSLVSLIIENYNGRIWVENRVSNDYSKGSKFIILIPEVKKES